MLHLSKKTISYTSDRNLLWESIIEQHSVPGRQPVFTTLRLCGSRPFFLKEHIDRLQQSAFLVFQEDISNIKEDIEHGLKEMAPLLCGNYKLKILLYPDLLMIAFPEKKSFNSWPPLKALTGRQSFSTPDFLKTNSMEKMLQMRHFLEKGFDDILYLDENDHILEFTTSNIFFTLSGVVYTPPLGSGILAGVTREKLIHCLRKNRVPVSIKNISFQTLLEADEVWQTNSIKGIRMVDRLEKTFFPSSENSLIKKIIPLFEFYCQEHG